MTMLTTQQLTIQLDQQILCHDLSMTLKPGIVTGILGPNGCGKTTLLHTLAGLRSPSRGSVLLNHFLLSTLSRRTIAQSIAFLFQHVQETFQQTVWEFCLAARYPHRAYFQRENEADKQYVIAALQQMEMHAYHHRKITALSGGEKRRLAIAAVLAQTPEIYLLDEPVNHLDVRHQYTTLHHFQQLAHAHNKTVLMSLHDINLAQQYCDEVLLIFPDGEILQGSTSQMLTTEHLTRLFAHPMIASHTAARVFWHPQVPAV